MNDFGLLTASFKEAISTILKNITEDGFDLESPECKHSVSGAPVSFVSIMQ